MYRPIQKCYITYYEVAYTELKPKIQSIALPLKLHYDAINILFDKPRNNCFPTYSIVNPKVQLKS